MQYDFNIREHNQQAHIDIEQDIAKQKNGLFTFILRVNNGNIVDYTVVEYADARKYLSLKKVVIQELTIAYDLVKRDQPIAIRDNNGQRTDS